MFTDIFILFLLKIKNLHGVLEIKNGPGKRGRGGGAFSFYNYYNIKR